MEYKQHTDRFLRHTLSMPFIYFMSVPMLTLDLSMEIYHQVCFRLYNLPLINRSQYIKFDRHKLQYLTTWEKINCSYCGYANGLAHYFSAIAGETEKYWCGVKHEKDPNFKVPKHQETFIEYGDKKSYDKLG